MPDPFTFTVVLHRFPLTPPPSRFKDVRHSRASEEESPMIGSDLSDVVFLREFFLSLRIVNSLYNTSSSYVAFVHFSRRELSF